MSRRTEERIPHRRGHTRWLMIMPGVGLCLVIVGIIVLEAVGPAPGPQVPPIEGLPSVAVLDDSRHCTRTDEQTLTEIREEHQVAVGRVTASQVYACPAAFDFLSVVYAGEVVGDLLVRRDGAWAQVNDDAYALEVGPLVGHRDLDGFNNGLSVWLPDGLHEMIEDVGRPARRGDVVLIEGTILQSDPADGGGITLRAEQLEVLAPSTAVEDPLHVPQAVVAALLAIAAIGAVVWMRRAR